MSQLPAPGSEILVFIQWVNLNHSGGFVEVWVDIDDKHMRADSAPSQSQNGAFLSSKGHVQTATKSTLTRSQNDNLQPPKSECCVLANVVSPMNTWSERATKFLKSLPGKKLNGVFQDVLMPERTIILEIPLVSNHMHRLGYAKKIPTEDFRLCLQSYLHSPQEDTVVCPLPQQQQQRQQNMETSEQYLYPELQTNLFETVEVTEVTNAHQIFCKLSIFCTELKKLSVQIHQYYEENSTFAKQQPQVCGSPCAAKAINGKWNRSLLMQDLVAGNGTVEVLYVDIGRREFVPVGDIRPLHETFLRMPVVTYPCSLSSVKETGILWTVDQTDDLKSVLLHQVVMAKFEHHDINKNICYVTLYKVEAESINKCFGAKAQFPTEGEIGVDVQGGESLNVKKLQGNMLPYSENSPVKAGTGGSCVGITSFTEASQIKKEPLYGDELNEPETSGAYKLSSHYIDVGGKEEVDITCSNSVNHFYCQLKRNANLFDMLMKDIKEVFQQSESKNQPFGVNGMCLARYTDDQWYRGQITVMHPNLHVHFVDYGDTVAVNKSDVRPFPVKATSAKCVPVQAILLGLFNVPAVVPQEVNNWFREHAVGHHFSISVVTKDSRGKLIVELFDGTLNVNEKVRERIAKTSVGQEAEQVQHLSFSPREPISSSPGETCQTQSNPNVLQKKQAEQKMDGQSTFHTTRPKGEHVETSDGCRKQSLDCTRIADIAPMSITQGLSTEVYISHFNNPDNFFVQLQKEENDLYSLVEMLQSPEPQSPSAVPLEFNDLHIGDVVNAEFPVDRSWYRAVVRHKHENKSVLVEFIDFGNEVTIPCVKIRPLEAKSATYPRFSIPCKLVAVSHIHERWNEEEISVFKRATVDNPEKTFTCKFIKETENIWDVVIKDQDTVLAKTFVLQGQSESNVTQFSSSDQNVKYKNPEVSQNETHEVYASCVVGPHFFWCQYANSEELDRISRFSQEVGPAEKQDVERTDALGPGSPCLALFADDKQWSRARVICKTGNTLFVLFIDYGNESEVDLNHVRLVPPSLLEKPPQAFLCSLGGFDESQGTWDDDALDEFYDLLVDKPLRVTVLSMEHNLESGIPQYTVRVNCGDMVLNRMMEKHWKALGTEDGVAAVPSSVSDLPPWTE